MKNGDGTALEIVSPFREIPIYETLTEEQLHYVYDVAGGFCDKYFNDLRDLGILPLRDGEPVALGLDKVKQTLNKSRTFAVYSHLKAYIALSINIPLLPLHHEDVRAKDHRVGEYEFGGMVLIAESEGLLHFSYSDSNGHDLTQHSENRVLYDAGISVLMSDLIGFDHLTRGQEILNTHTRQRLGDGIPAGERDRHVVLKLAEPDENGNLVLQQQIKQ